MIPYIYSSSCYSFHVSLGSYTDFTKPRISLGKFSNAFAKAAGVRIQANRIYILESERIKLYVTLEGLGACTFGHLIHSGRSLKKGKEVLNPKKSLGESVNEASKAYST
jgi:hypothetical protein